MPSSKGKAAPVWPVMEREGHKAFLWLRKKHTVKLELFRDKEYSYSRKLLFFSNRLCHVCLPSRPYQGFHFALNSFDHSANVSHNVRHYRKV